jgi:Sigma-70 region 3
MTRPRAQRSSRSRSPAWWATPNATGATPAGGCGYLAPEEQALRLSGAADELHQTLGRTPTTAELAEHLNVTEEVVLEASAAATSRQEISLDQSAGDDTPFVSATWWPPRA